MDISTFETKLKAELKHLAYVQKIVLTEINPRILKGKITLIKTYRLSIFFNAALFNMSFSLIYKNNRIWGLDKDTDLSWHVHPLHNVQTHQPIEEKNIAEIIAIFDELWQKLQTEMT